MNAFGHASLRLEITLTPVATSRHPRVQKSPARGSGEFARPPTSSRQRWPVRYGVAAGAPGDRCPGIRSAPELPIDLAHNHRSLCDFPSPADDYLDRPRNCNEPLIEPRPPPLVRGWPGKHDGSRKPSRRYCASESCAQRLDCCGTIRTANCQHEFGSG